MTTEFLIDHYPFLENGGELASLIHAYDWSKTAAGPLASWGAAMRSTLALMLRSPVPIVTLWGEPGVMIYNDAYSVFAGGRHPQLMGSNVREGWPEVADFNDNVMKVGLSGGTLRYEDQELTLHRSGKPEQVWMNLDYSPICDENGLILGVIAVVVETTSKVQAERWNRGERERLQAMFEQAPGFMALLQGPHYRFEFINAAYERLIGGRQVIGLSALEVFPEAEVQGFITLLDEVYASGKPFVGSAMPLTLPDAHGKDRTTFVDFVFQPLRDNEGKVMGIFIEGADVTDRVDAERVMRDSEARYRAFAQAMPHQVWTSPADGQLDWFNDRVHEYCGLDIAQLVGAGWTSIVHPEDLDGAATTWNASIASGEPYEREFRLLARDGGYRWHLSRAVPIRASDNRIERWIGTNTDVHEQRAASTAMANLNQTLEEKVRTRTAERDRMWRLSKDLFLVASLDGTIAAVNPAWGNVIGWHEDETVGKRFFSFVHSRDQHTSLSQFEQLRRGGDLQKFESLIECKDGSHRLIAWSIVAQDSFFHAIGRDITDERDQQNAMRRTEMALQQAQKMETIGQLTGGVAHDFNNLLQVIGGNLQLLVNDVAGQESARRKVASALKGVERGAKLASYLLAFGRRQPLEPKVVKLGRLISGMEDMLRRTLGEAIEVECVISGGLWNTCVDTAQVENAILNLAVNARDAMSGAGKLTIEISNAHLDDRYVGQHPDVESGQYVVVSVSDTGIGMTAEVLAKAFEPFFSTKAEGHGSGLGLSMVYGFVKQSGGHVKIYSEVGAGTTVKAYLPRSLAVEDVSVLPDQQPMRGGTETILVAEDDSEVRETVVEMLKELGYSVLRAHDASSAWTVLESGVHVDLLFTDVVMPGPLRSPDLVRKAKERFPNLMVLFTSGYTENAIVHGGRLDAGVALLGKPYTREALARKIRHVLSDETPSETQKPPRPLIAPLPRKKVGVALTILLVEDDDMVRELTGELLIHFGHSVMFAADGLEGIEMLKLKPDLVITDLTLPGASGEQVASAAFDAGISVVIATGNPGKVAFKNAVVLGKPFDDRSLRGAIDRACLRTDRLE